MQQLGPLHCQEGAACGLGLLAAAWHPRVHVRACYLPGHSLWHRPLASSEDCALPLPKHKRCIALHELHGKAMHDVVDLERGEYQAQGFNPMHTPNSPCVASPALTTSLWLRGLAPRLQLHQD